MSQLYEMNYTLYTVLLYMSVFFASLSTKAEKTRNEVPEGCKLSSKGLAEQEAILSTCTFKYWIHVLE